MENKRNLRELFDAGFESLATIPDKQKLYK